MYGSLVWLSRVAGSGVVRGREFDDQRSGGVYACAVVVGVGGQHELPGGLDVVGVDDQVRVESLDVGVAVEVAEEADGNIAQPVAASHLVEGRLGGRHRGLVYMA